VLAGREERSRTLGKFLCLAVAVLRSRFGCKLFLLGALGHGKGIHDGFGRVVGNASAMRSRQIHGLFFDHPRPGKIQGACFRIFPLNPILRRRGIFAFRDFRFWQTSCSEGQRVPLTTRSISTVLCGGESPLFPERATLSRSLFRLNSQVEIR
jgi:hypothetical protein